MEGVEAFFDAVIAVLEGSDEEAAYLLIRAVGSRDAGEGVVQLVEGDLRTREALGYARVLLDIGHRVEATDVVHAAVAAQLGEHAADIAPMARLAAVA